MGNVAREMKTLRKNQKGILEMRKTVTDITNTSDGLISRLTTAEKAVSEHKDRSIEISQTNVHIIKKKEHKNI